ncbi:MAG: YfhO family protein [Clostridiales bacterium]|nr:YfhO family protein [Clostridiales bacterium]
MADSVKTNEQKKKLPKVSLDSTSKGFKDWAYKNRFYILAFFIPAIITYIAYAMFEVYPFGDNSVLVLDLNGQYIYYFEALRDAFWGDGSIFYNWSRNLSGEYMGIIGYYLASPFTLIVMLLPRTMILGSVLIMQLCKVGASGVTFCLFMQKSKDARPINAIIFSTMYALMGYAVTQLMDPMWIDGLVFLPLIMLGVEYIVDTKKKINYIIPLALMFVANFYIGYMVGAFTFLYFLYYVFFGSTKLKRNIYDIFSVFVKFGVYTAISLMCAAVMLLPVYYSLKLGKFDFTTPDFSFKLQFTAADFFPKLLPSSYDTVRNEGMPSIYAGILTILMLPLFYMNTKISTREKVGKSLLAVALFFSMYIKPLDMAWHGFQVPNWLPYRYSFLFSFVILTMAATAFENIEGISKKAIGGSVFGIIIYLLYIDKQQYDYLDSMGSIWFAIACIVIFAAFINVIRENPRSKVIPVAILLIVGIELVINANQTFKDINDDVTYSKHSSYYEIINAGREVVKGIEKNDDSLYRADKTYFRTSNDALALRLKGISHSSSVMNSKALNFIDALGYDASSFDSRYTGATPVADSLLGIKYVLDKEKSGKEKVSELYEPLYEYQIKNKDGQSVKETITAYQNPNALAIAYMANDDVLQIGKLLPKNPFENQNNLLGAITGDFDNSYYKELQLNGSPTLRNVTQSAYGDQIKYTAEKSGDPTVEYHFYTESKDPVYMYLYTKNQKKVRVWVSTQKNDKGEFTTGQFTDLGNYFEGHDYTVLKIGNFEPGQEVAVRLTVGKDDYTIISEPYFYYLDVEKYNDAMDSIKAQQLNLTDWSTTKIEGTIDAGNGQVMMTSIPYEPGWTIKVDGKKVEPVIIADAMIGVRLPAGTHDIKMTFVPKGFVPGLILAILGVGCVVLIYIYDNKKVKTKK